MANDRPKLAVWKFASCDGCQLSLLDCEDELLAVSQAVHIANFPEASREVVPGPYEISLVEGSVTTPHDAERIKEIREISDLVITIGACATSGGIQALRNFSDVKEFTNIVYANPQFIDTLDQSHPISDYINVDFELRGCPIDKYQLLEVVISLLSGKRPNIPTHSVCMDCKLKLNTCVLVAGNEPCLGPVTQAGCGAICPSFNRGCYGFFGPQDSANTDSMTEIWQNLGVENETILQAFRGFNGFLEPFKSAGERLE